MTVAVSVQSEGGLSSPLNPPPRIPPSPTQQTLGMSTMESDPAVLISASPWAATGQRNGAASASAPDDDTTCCTFGWLQPRLRSFPSVHDNISFSTTVPHHRTWLSATAQQRHAHPRQESSPGPPSPAEKHVSRSSNPPHPYLSLSETYQANWKRTQRSSHQCPCVRHFTPGP